MLRKTAFVIFGVMACSLGYHLGAQVSDCVGAIVICSDDTVEFAPLDNGNSDFANPNNDPGCLEDDENGTVWYYFEFNPTMPPNSELEFTLDPFGGFLEDYDFAIYGPNLACDSLGSPVRCSFANGFCDLCPLTGMGMGATDTSEGWDQEDGFIAPLVVQPGEGFYLVIDYFAGNGFGFQLSWGGSAAPYLNCLADPACNQYTVDAGADIILCDGIDTLLLQPSFSDTTALVDVVWTDTSGATTFLDNDSIANPQLMLPDTFTGQVVYQMAADFGGCIKYDYLTISVQASPTPQIIGDNLICPGTSTNLSVGNYSEYHWSTDSTSQQISVTAEGQYMVTVTNEYGCSGADTATISFFPTMSTQIVGASGICAGDTIELSVNDDFQIYDWSTNDQNDTIAVTAPGIYFVTVTDANNCTQIDSIEIQELTTPNPVIIGQDTICMGTEGLLDAGNGFIEYLWSTNEITSSITPSQAGNYGLTVTNEDGCTASTSFDLAVVDNPVASISGDLAYCEGQSTILSGGMGPNVQYDWTGGADTDQIIVDMPGNYGLTVTNEFGCKDSTEVEVDVLALPDFALPDQLGLCEGLAITVNGAGDTLSYLWTGGSIADSLVVTAAGIYSVTVTGGNGCAVIEPFEVLENPAPEPEITGDEGFCMGGNAQLEVGPWASYEWSTGDATATVSVDQPGLVSVTVTDALGCVGAGTFLVQEWSLPQPEIIGDTIFCPGGETTLGSALNYLNYQWSTGDDTPQIITNDTTVIGLTVTDVNGCIGTTSIDINTYAVDHPAPPGDTTFCAGDTVQLDAGIGYQSYLWSDNSDSRFLTTSMPGDYSLIVIDQNGCSDTTNFTLQMTALPEPDITPDFSVCPGSETEIIVSGVYLAYEWSTGDQDTSILVQEPGTYSVTVEDANHCLGTASMNLANFIPPQPEILGTQTFCENTQTVLAADAPYETYLWSTGDEISGITVSEEGTVGLTVTDSNGCTGMTEVEITALPLPQVEIDGPEHICEGSSTTLQVSQGFVTYLWSNGTDSNQIEVAVADTFSVTVTDSNGCTASAIQSIEEIELPPVDAGEGDTINCHNGSVQIGTVIDGPYSYQWVGPGITDNAFDPMPTVDEGGLYFLVMKDTVYGCESAVDTALVEDIRYEPEVVLELENILDCAHQTTEIDGSASTNGSNMIYRWFDASGALLQEGINSNLEVATGGMYSLQVHDVVTGCEASASIDVPANFSYLEVTAGTDTELTCYENVVSLSGEVTALQNEYTVDWQTIDGHIVSDGNTLTPVIDEPGTYILHVYNMENGCISQDTVTVEDQTIPPVAVAGASNALDCVFRTASLSADGSSTGPHITYKWENETGVPLNGANPEIETPGAYWLIVADQNTGCTDTAQVEVLDVSDPPLALNLEIVQPKCYQEATGVLTVASVEGGTEPYLYRLQDDNGFRVANVFDQLASGEYQVVVQDAEGCEIVADFEIEQSSQVLLDIGPDQYIKLGEEVNLDALTNLQSEEIAELLWLSSAGDSCNVCNTTWSLRPNESMNVLAEITDINGCKALDELMIFVNKDRSVYIPNAISPNLDGINDYFTVYADKSVQEIKTMKIFDRWGGKVYEDFDFAPNNPALGWNGRYGSSLANGNVFVYFIVIEFVDGEQVEFSGDVTIIY